MAKVIICFILTCFFSFMGYSSFMTNDSKPLQEWFMYYKEYKELQGAMDKGNVKKAELLAKLKTLYPEKAKEIEDMARNKYIDLSDEAKSIESDVTSSRRTEESAPRRDTSPTQQQTQQPKQTKNDTARTTNSTNSTTNNANNTNNKSKQ